MKYKYVLLLLFSFSSCIPASEFEDVMTENSRLTSQITDLKLDIIALKYEIEQLKKKKIVEATYTEDSVLKLLKEYYTFYKRDEVYRKPKVKRVSSNIFHISLEECTKKGEFKENNFFWHSSIYELTIYGNGKYEFNRLLN